MPRQIAARSRRRSCTTAHQLRARRNVFATLVQPLHRQPLRFAKLCFVTRPHEQLGIEVPLRDYGTPAPRWEVTPEAKSSGKRFRVAAGSVGHIRGE